jgi:hypothetical protein
VQNLLLDGGHRVVDLLDGRFAVAVVGLTGVGTISVSNAGCLLERSTEHVVDGLLLLVRHLVVDVRDSLVDVGLVGVLDRRTIGVLERQVGEDDCLVLELVDGTVGVSHGDVVDLRTRVGAGQNQRHLPDHAVENLLALLDQLVGVDRELVDVLVLNEDLGVLTGRRRVEEAVGVDALVTVLENRVAEDVVGRVVAVLPDERNSHLVLVLEGLRHDGPTIRALETSLGRPTAEIGFHLLSPFY